MRKFLSLILLFSAVLVSCEKETRDLKQIEDEEIKAFIKTNNLTGFVKDESGYYYQILNQGSGDQLKYSDLIAYVQQVKVLGGGEIKTEGSRTPTLSNYAYIRSYLGYISPVGFRESIVKLNLGGRVRVIVPSYLAYGKDGFGSIVDGNTILDATFYVPNTKDETELGDILITQFKSTIPSTFTRNAAGVYYQIINPGTGTETVTLTSNLKIAYTGRLFDGTVFDSAPVSSPFQSTLNSLIEGWKTTVPLIKKGGKIRILIPSYLAYGPSGNAAIPSNAPLDFDIELVDVTN
jgi:FKBP-type peptidyl-prolyl cis-trans isomerase FkpA